MVEAAHPAVGQRRNGSEGVGGMDACIAAVGKKTRQMGHAGISIWVVQLERLKRASPWGQSKEETHMPAARRLSAFAVLAVATEAARRAAASRWSAGQPLWSERSNRGHSQRSTRMRWYQAAATVAVTSEVSGAIRSVDTSVSPI